MRSDAALKERKLINDRTREALKAAKALRVLGV
jgi:hypothetical protein